MKKKTLHFFLILFIGLTSSICSLAQSQRKDFDSTTLSIVTQVLTKSINIALPERVTDDLKLFAIQNNLPQNLVLKNSIALKMLYNNNLTYNEKKVYLEWAVENYSTENKYLPIKYFKEALIALKQ